MSTLVVKNTMPAFNWSAVVLNINGPIAGADFPHPHKLPLVGWAVVRDDDNNQFVDGLIVDPNEPQWIINGMELQDETSDQYRLLGYCETSEPISDQYIEDAREAYLAHKAATR